MDAPGTAAAPSAPCARSLISKSWTTRSATSAFALSASAGLLESANQRCSHVSLARPRAWKASPSACAAQSVARRVPKSSESRFCGRAEAGDKRGRQSQKRDQSATADRCVQSILTRQGGSIALARPRGVCRTPRPRPLEDDAKVTDGSITYDLPESQYRARGYQPPFEQLPLCPESAPHGAG